MVIAFEMIEAGYPKVRDQLVLTYPKKWSSAASGFLSATTQGTLNDTENVRKLYAFLLRAFLMALSNSFLRRHNCSELKHKGACGVLLDRLYRMATAYIVRGLESCAS